MKRELKDTIFYCIKSLYQAAAQIPMKRELKVAEKHNCRELATKALQPKSL